MTADKITRPLEAQRGSEADIRLVAKEGVDGKWRMPYERAAVVGMWGELSREVPALPVRRPTMLVNALKAGFVLDPQTSFLARELGDDLIRHEVNLGHMVYWEDLALTGKLVSDFLR